MSITAFEKSTLVRSAPVKLAFIKTAFVKFAPVNIASAKFAPVNFRNNNYNNNLPLTLLVFHQWRILFDKQWIEWIGGVGVLCIATEKPWDIRDLVWSKEAGSVATDGVYLKTGMIIDGAKHYLKLSNYDSYRGIFGHEAVNELIASRLGSVLEVNVPKGTLRKSLVRVEEREYEAYVFSAESYKTTHSREAFENYYVAHRLSERESPLDLCKRFCWEDDIYKMFIFDYLIINRDRHGANLEVMKNKNSKLSPLFDNGLSFVCSCTEESDLESFDTMHDRPVNNFIGTKYLKRNLELIDKRVKISELTESNRETLFRDLDGVLSNRYFTYMWEIIWRRWQDVKKFRAA